jgi:hypothetical protein
MPPGNQTAPLDSPELKAALARLDELSSQLDQDPRVRHAMKCQGVVGQDIPELARRYMSTLTARVMTRLQEADLGANEDRATAFVTAALARAATGFVTNAISLDKALPGLPSPLPAKKVVPDKPENVETVSLRSERTDDSASYRSVPIGADHALPKITAPKSNAGAKTFKALPAVVNSLLNREFGMERLSSVASAVGKGLRFLIPKKASVPQQDVGNKAGVPQRDVRNSDTTHDVLKPSTNSDAVQELYNANSDAITIELYGRDGDPDTTNPVFTVTLQRDTSSRDVAWWAPGMSEALSTQSQLRTLMGALNTNDQYRIHLLVPRAGTPISESAQDIFETQSTRSSSRASVLTKTFEEVQSDDEKPPPVPPKNDPPKTKYLALAERCATSEIASSTMWNLPGDAVRLTIQGYCPAGTVNGEAMEVPVDPLTLSRQLLTNGQLGGWIDPRTEELVSDPLALFNELNPSGGRFELFYVQPNVVETSTAQEGKGIGTGKGKQKAGNASSVPEPLPALMRQADTTLQSALMAYLGTNDWIYGNRVRLDTPELWIRVDNALEDIVSYHEKEGTGLPLRPSCWDLDYRSCSKADDLVDLIEKAAGERLIVETHTLTSRGYDVQYVTLVRADEGLFDSGRWTRCDTGVPIDDMRSFAAEMIRAGDSVVVRKIA